MVEEKWLELIGSAEINNRTITGVHIYTKIS
jgi:hypothetical protein